MVGDVRQALFIVFGAVFMVLLIACANVANLMLVRGTARRTEMAVRAVLGAGRRRLLSQLITESALVAAIGTVVGVLLASWGVDVLRDIATDDFPRAAEIGLDARALLFATLIAGITVALFGLAPALQMSNVPFAQSLREGGRGATGGRHRTRALILGVEVALSVTLLLGAGLMLRSLARVRSVDPGFDSAQVTHFRFSLPDARYPDPAQSVRFVESVQERLAAISGVESAGFILGLPMSGLNIFGGFTRLDQPPPEPGRSPSVSYRGIDSHYLATLGIPLLSGRNFEPSDRVGAQPVVIVDDLLAQRYFPGEDPIGKQIDVQVSTGYPDTLPRTIVGVVGSVRARSLTEAPEPALYVPDRQTGSGFGHFVFRSTRGTDEVLRAAREVLSTVDAQVPMIRPGSMDDLLAADRARHTFYLMLLGMFALLAVTLAAVGMYGVVAFAVAQRTREIGVRMALGARAREVISLVVWQGLRPALYGAAIGMAGALAAGRLIAGLLYQVAPRDPLTLLGVTGVLLGVVVIACSVPARRATRIPPAIALRE
jgi:predicted permease